jgi:subtilisin family serine protease
MSVVPKTITRIATVVIGLVVLIATPTLATEWPHVPGQIIVKFAPEVHKVDVQRRGGLVFVGLESLDQRMERYGVYWIGQLFPHKKSELASIYQFDFDPQYDALDVAQDFTGDEHLLYAEPRYVHRLFEEPNDEVYLTGIQWYFNTVQAQQAWDIAHGDSSVIIGIVDSGVDWDHPDLADNIWVNPGEDLNGDGQITGIDWNNADDDSNGYIDDFFGWDFAGLGYPDNNPMDFGIGHGTHVAGIAAAVTNNAEGIAGMSWNCTIMAVKTSVDESPYVPYGYEGILYAADNGADVINCSWGGPGFSQFDREIIDSALARGAIVVTSAGNDPGTSPPDTCPANYPSFYDPVIAVAATNQSDRAAGFTYYGSWVDVSAPGVGIYSTAWDDTYRFLQGTSFSSPLVAGVAALLRSVDPDMTVEEFEAKMWYTSDDIDHLNPGYEGWLGGGRVNAHKALLSLTEPLLMLETETTIDDAGGNQDGRPDPGETVDWIVSLSNTPAWQLAQDVQTSVSTPDETITFLVNSTGFGDIDGGATADNSADPFQFSVSDTAEAHWTTFYFQVEANGGTYAMVDSMEMLIGRPQVLLVDDDGGDNLEEVYQDDLEKVSVVYDTWDVAQSGKVSAEELVLYSVVIWLTGAEVESTLTAQDRDHLVAFLDAGNKLFLTGQNIGDEVGGEAFFSDYLHVSHVTDTVSVAEPYLDGVGGDVLSDGTTLLIVGAEPQSSPSGVEAVGGSAGIYTYRDDPTGPVAAARYESLKGYKVVYFAFGYEGIRGTGGYTPGWMVLERILNWFDVQTHPTEVDLEVETGELPRKYALSQNYPNPFNAETDIVYHLPDGAGQQLTSLRVYNILGQEVRTLVEEIQGPGTYRVRWDSYDLRGEEIATGVYFYRLESGNFAQTKKMVLLK